MAFIANSAYTSPPDGPICLKTTDSDVSSGQTPSSSDAPGQTTFANMTNFQIHMSAMKYNLTRCPIKLPAKGLYLMTMPRFIQRP